MGLLGGKVALVTGGGRGIGREIALALARAGAGVAVASRTLAEVKMVAIEINHLGGKALPVQADVSEPAQVARMVRDVESELGPVDILVNNAALGLTGVRPKDKRLPLFWEVSPMEWQQLLSVNLSGPFFCSREVVPSMRQRKYGKIINVSTGLARFFRPGFGPYSTSKAGLEGLSKQMAADLAGERIDVNAIAPGGAVDTSFIRKNTLSREQRSALLPPDCIVPPVLYLASPDSDGFSGHILDLACWQEQVPKRPG